MNRAMRVVAAAAVLVSIAGCASEYIISTNSGVMITAKGQPKLDEKTGMYKYKDEEGRTSTIKKEEVKQVMER